MKHIIKITGYEDKEIEYNDDADYITLVKVGDKNSPPTLDELEEWRKIFEDASNDENFKIFTNTSVEIKQIKVNGKLIVK